MMFTRLKLVRQVLIVSTMAFLAGCAGSSAVSFYTLSPVEEVSSSTQLKLAIAVGPSELPRELQRNQVVTRTSANVLRINEAHRWAGSLSIGFDRTIADNLERMLPVERVVAYPVQPRGEIDYRVVIDVREFTGAPGETVVLRGAWSLVDGSGQLVRTAAFSFSQPATGEGIEGLVAAHSAAIGELSQQIATVLQN